jgi:GDP-L-fucose synthase
MIKIKSLKNENILLLGSTGLAGYAIKNELKKNKISFFSPMRSEINLFKIEEIINYLKEKEITMIINAAAKVGGIYANIKNPIDFYYENSIIQDNVIYASVKNNIKKIVFLSSACIYPENNDTIPEFYSNDMSYQNLHKTNLGYTLAKKNHIDVLKMTYEKYDIKFLYLIISNMFGINDNFSDESSHFIPIVMKKLHQAKIEKRKELNLFAVKNIYREFMFNEDFAFNFINLLNAFSFENDYMNFGSGMEYDLYDLIFKINDIVKFKGEIIIKEPETIGNKKRIMNLDFLKSKINIYNTNIDKCLKKTYKFHFHK